MAASPKFWFRAKRHGWGWGPPIAWQGWAVLIVFFALVLVGAFVLLPPYGQRVYVAYTFILCLVLVAICWIKGEPPGGGR
jgi:hypothetical protein